MIPRWLCFLALLLRIEVRGWNQLPRKTVRYSGVSEVRQPWRSGNSHYLTFLLDEQRGALYVGAREIIFALDLQNIRKELHPRIKWEAPSEKKMECVNKGKNNLTECLNYIRILQKFNETHLLTCGTYAFQPKCTYIELSTFTLDSVNLEDGKGRCPYDPSTGHTGIVVEGALYSATFFNFLATEPVIQRSVGQHNSLKTEYLASWLNEPNFVGSSHIPESFDSEFGDDDKIYFFFTERALEYDCSSEKIVSRVARVCKGDLGGARILQRKWTSFLKARLVCSIPEQQLQFNQLKAVYTLHGNQWRDTQFFAVFQALWGDVSVSAVCQYTIQDIQKAFDGPYKQYQEEAQKWGRYSASVPVPRPGSCITDYHKQHGMSKTSDLPDNTLNFVKTHPLMDESVQPVNGRPLLVRKGVNFTTIAVHQAPGINKKLYDVLFIGTGNGWLNKAVGVGSSVHLIEELQMFDKPYPVHNLVISSRTSLLFGGSPTGLVQLPLADCSKYRSCADCVLARDPFCAWNMSLSRCVQFDGKEGDLYQNIENADTSVCDIQFNKAVKPLSRNLTVAVGTNVALPCELTSNLAQPLWTFNGRELSQEDDDSVLYDITLQALVILEAGIHHSGTYYCFSVEEGTRFASEHYQLSVVASPSLTLESRAPMDGLGLVWMMVIALGAVCLALFLAVVYLRRKLQDEMEKGSKSLENTLVYPIQLPSQSKMTKCLPSADSDEKLWDPSSFYYSDGSLKIVPGHALCQNSTSSSSPSGNGIPGQPLPSPPLHSPNHMLVRGSSSNGYIRLTLGNGVGEERPPLGDLNEELRWKLKQRQTLPDANPEESSV
ncbi:semaphorin-4C [Gastrophryne carolinensis]